MKLLISVSYNHRDKIILYTLVHLVDDVWRSNGEEWYRLRSGVQRLMLDLQSVGTFLPLINPVADDFVQRILQIRDADTGAVESLDNEIAKWNLECEFALRCRLC